MSVFTVRNVNCARREETAVECDIELDGGVVSRDTIAKLMCEICKYLMYDRQQIPFPMSRAPNMITLNDKLPQLSANQTRVLRLIDCCNQLFDELICISSAQQITSIDCVCLSLGQTLQTPKELYCIKMHSTDVYDTRHSNNCNKVGLRSSVTRFFKTILNDGNILFKSRKEIGITKAYLLIRLKRTEIEHLMQHSVKHHSIDANNSEQTLFTPLNNYQFPKVGNRFKFIIKMKACDICNAISDEKFDIFEDKDRSEDVDDDKLKKNVTILTINESSLSPNKSQIDSNQDYIWIQIKSPIKGVIYNSSSKDELLTDF